MRTIVVSTPNPTVAPCLLWGDVLALLLSEGPCSLCLELQLEDSLLAKSVLLHCILEAISLVFVTVSLACEESTGYAGLCEDGILDGCASHRLTYGLLSQRLVAL